MTIAAEVDALASTFEEDMDKRDLNGLDEVRMLTQMMREHQASIERLGERRRRTVLRLRDHRVKYREIAEAMGVSEQAVYKIIRDL